MMKEKIFHVDTYDNYYMLEIKNYEIVYIKKLTRENAIKDFHIYKSKMMKSKSIFPMLTQDSINILCPKNINQIVDYFHILKTYMENAPILGNGGLE